MRCYSEVHHSFCARWFAGNKGIITGADVPLLNSCSRTEYHKFFLVFLILILIDFFFFDKTNVDKMVQVDKTNVELENHAMLI